MSQEFEALLLSLVFKAMRQTVPKSDFLGKARDRDWYADLFDFELAKNFTHGKSLGLSAYLQQELQRMPNRQAPHPHAGAPRPSPAWHAEPVTSADPRLPTAATEVESLSEAMILPMIGRLSSHYGERSDPLTGEVKFHHGIDVASPTGTEIHAALPGTVAFSGWQQGYGQTVILYHEHGYTTQYAHASETLVQVGERVNRGQAIALVGQSGRATGPHLHFEVRKDGQSVDPMPFLAQRTAV